MLEPGPSFDFNIQNENEKTCPKTKKYFWRGKRVSEKVYFQRLKQVKVARNIWKRGRFKSPNLPLNITYKAKDESTSDSSGVEGRRIIHINTLGAQMFCWKCKSILSLFDISSEKLYGLASTFYVQCRSCGSTTSVNTDKKHKTTDNKLHLDCNTKVAMGILNGGLGNTHLNKVLAALNIPEMNWHTYQTHEKEVGKVIEELAHESCIAAALEERRLTIKNADKLKDLL